VNGHEDVCRLLLNPPGQAHPAQVDAAWLTVYSAQENAASLSSAIQQYPAVVALLQLHLPAQV
jgi:hypothetical protein